MKLRQTSACTALVALALSFASVTPTHAANAGGKCSKVGALSGTTVKPLICKQAGKKLVWRNLSTTLVTDAPTTTVFDAGRKCSKVGALSGTRLRPLICKRVEKKLVWSKIPTTTVTVAPTTTVYVVPTTTVTVAPTTTVTVAPTTTVARSSCPTGQIRIVPDKLWDGYLFFFNVYNETSASVQIDYVRVKFFGSNSGTSITSSIWSQDFVYELRSGWKDYRRAQSNVYFSPNGFLYDGAYRWYRTQYDVYQGNRLCSPPQVVIDQTVLASSK